MSDKLEIAISLARWLGFAFGVTFLTHLITVPLWIWTGDWRAAAINLFVCFGLYVLSEAADGIVAKEAAKQQKATP